MNVHAHLKNENNQTSGTTEPMNLKLRNCQVWNIESEKIYSASFISRPIFSVNLRLFEGVYSELEI